MHQGVVSITPHLASKARRTLSRLICIQVSSTPQLRVTEMASVLDQGPGVLATLVLASPIKRRILLASEIPDDEDDELSGVT